MSGCPAFWGPNGELVGECNPNHDKPYQHTGMVAVFQDVRQGQANVAEELFEAGHCFDRICDKTPRPGRKVMGPAAPKDQAAFGKERWLYQGRHP